MTRTISGRVYARLRSDIVAATLPPGDKLRIEALCARYGVTSTPMREALNQLTSEGFVHRQEQQGFRVAPVSLEELGQLTQTRCWVEAIALREAVAARSAAWEQRLESAWQSLRETPRSLTDEEFQENPAWETVHREFHMALIATCPSHWLITFCGQLSDHAMRYRRLAMSTAFPQRDVTDEHGAILRAALAGNTAAAVAALKAHYRRTETIVMRQAGTEAGAGGGDPRAPTLRSGGRQCGTR